MKLTAKQVAADRELAKRVGARTFGYYAEALQEAMLRLRYCHDELKCEQRNCPTRAVIDDFFEPEGSGEGKK